MHLVGFIENKCITMPRSHERKKMRFQVLTAVLLKIRAVFSIVRPYSVGEGLQAGNSLLWFKAVAA